MQGPSHLVITWFAAEAAGLESPRERRIVALSGLAPDIDVLAYLAAIVYFGFDKDLAFEHVWEVFHHRYTHGLGFVLLTGVVAYLIARRGAAAGHRQRAVAVAGLSMAASMIHVFCDVVGGGPTWPVYPLWPLADFGWGVSWSWTLADWPNNVILFFCLAGMMVYGRQSGYSPLEAINYDLDRWFVRVLQQGSDTAAQQANAVESNALPRQGAARLRAIIYLAVALLVLAVLVPLGFNLGQ
ncbi:MAG: metal-dependent hydrolase [Gammaproteobacteria bacterium]|nr:metal-dependent hydrolase [Gammaproteobacteria bacterium]